MRFQLISIRCFVFSICLFVFECLPFKSSCQDAHDILNAYFRAVITKDGNNWEDINTIYIEGQGFHDLKQFNQATPNLTPPKSNFSKQYIQVGDKEAIYLYADSTYEVQLSKFFFSKNKVIILLGGVDPIIKEPGEHQRFFEFDATAIKRLVGEAVSLTYNGLRSPGNAFNGEYQEVEIVTKDKKMLLYFGTDTHLLEFWTTIHDDNSSGTSHLYDYQDYQGFLIPRSRDAFRNGMIFFWTRIEKMTLNAEIESTIFDYKRHLR